MKYIRRALTVPTVAKRNLLSVCLSVCVGWYVESLMRLSSVILCVYVCESACLWVDFQMQRCTNYKNIDKMDNNFK